MMKRRFYNEATVFIVKSGLDLRGWFPTTSSKVGRYLSKLLTHAADAALTLSRSGHCCATLSRLHLVALCTLIEC